MDFIRNTFYAVIIVIVSYILMIFVMPNMADSIGEKLGTKSINENLRNFKSGLDFFSTDDKNGNVVEKVSEFQSGVIQARDIITDKIDETKTDIDATRKAVDETNKNIQKTQEQVNATLDSINQVQDGLKEIAQ